MATLRKDGRLQSSVILTNPITGEKEKKYIYGYTKEELEYERRAIQNNLTNNLTLTLKEWTNDVLLYKVKENLLSQETKDNYDLVLEKHLYPNLGSVDISKITPFMLRKCFSGISGQRAKQYVYTIIKSVFKQAVRDRLIDFNPCDSIDKPRVDTKETKTLTVDEFKRVLDTLEDEQLKYIVKTCWECGIRRGEVAALKWTDIDFENKTISINKALKIAKGGSKLGSPKTKAGIRTLLVTDEYLSEISEWKEKIKKILQENNVRWSESGFIFRAKTDLTKPPSLTTLTKNFASILRQLNLPDGTKFHSLRYSHATILTENDVHAKKVQLRLGHSSAAFTMDRYTHSTPKMQEGITAIVEKNR